MSETNTLASATPPDAPSDLPNLPDALKGPSEIVTDYAEMDQRLAVLRNAALDFLKPALLTIMRQHGVARLVVEFDGSGDSGQIERVTAFTAANEEQDLPGEVIRYAWPDGDCIYAPAGSPECTRELLGYQITPKTAREPFPSAIETVCYHLLWITHAGWENNDGAYGEITFDVARESITLDFNERYIEVTSSWHEW